MLTWLLASVAAGVLISRWRGAKELALPTSARWLAPYFTKWSAQSGIPPEVLAAWAGNESNYKPREYNPELGVIQSWACQIAGDPRWSDNPDFGKAQQVCARLSQGRAPEDVVADWTFGSFGLFQVSRLAAADVGLARSARNDQLFDLEVNAWCAMAVIRRKAEGLGLVWRPATYDDATWARVRAAYVMGVAGSRRAPEKAQQIGDKLLVALHRIRAATTLTT